MGGLREFNDAVRARDFSLMKILFNEEFVNERDSAGVTSLHLASEMSDGDIVRYLIYIGYKVEAETIVGRLRPVHSAALHGNTETLEALIEAQCSLDCVTSVSCIIWNLLWENIEAQCSLDCVTSDRRTPLDCARESTNGNYVECIRLLEEAMKLIWIGHITERVIGTGGFGRVYKCHNTRTMGHFVKKEVLLSVNNQDTKKVKALEKEIDLYTKFGVNLYIVQYYGRSRTYEAMFIYLEYMDGGSIKDKLITCKTLPPDTIASYTKQILNGLVFLHANNVIHRDIKPDNILLDNKGNVKICDFGISRYLSRVSSVANTFCGTHYYMAPEVIKEEKYGFPADIWSLGVTVLEMLTGHTLYPGLTQYQIVFKIANATKVEYDIPETTPQELRSFLGQMLIYEPGNRATAELLLETQFILGAITPSN